MNSTLFADPDADSLDRVTRALSLTQPWATLVAIGAKRYETRSWGSDYRGWMAIHASKKFPEDCRALFFAQPFRDVLERAGYRKPMDLPVGQIVAVARLTEVHLTNRWQPETWSAERSFGDYSPNRFAWRLEDVRKTKLLPMKGALSIWRLPRALNQDDLA